MRRSEENEHYLLCPRHVSYQSTAYFMTHESRDSKDVAVVIIFILEGGTR